MQTDRPENRCPNVYPGRWELPGAAPYRSPADVVAALTAVRMHGHVFSHAAAILSGASENRPGPTSETAPACR